MQAGSGLASIEGGREGECEQLVRRSKCKFDAEGGMPSVMKVIVPYCRYLRAKQCGAVQCRAAVGAPS